MGCVAPAVPSKLGWVPRHCQKNGVKSPLLCCFFCVVGYPPKWGKRPRYIDIDRCIPSGCGHPLGQKCLFVTLDRE